MNEACKKIIIRIQFRAIYSGRVIDYVDAIGELWLLKGFAEAMGNQDVSFVENAAQYMSYCGQFTQTLDRLPDPRLLIGGVQGIDSEDIERLNSLMELSDREETHAHIEKNRGKVPDRAW